MCIRDRFSHVLWMRGRKYSKVVCETRVDECDSERDPGQYGKIPCKRMQRSRGDFTIKTLARDNAHKRRLEIATAAGPMGEEKVRSSSLACFKHSIP